MNCSKDKLSFRLSGISNKHLFCVFVSLLDCARMLNKVNQLKESTNYFNEVCKSKHVKNSRGVVIIFTKLDLFKCLYASVLKPKLEKLYQMKCNLPQLDSITDIVSG